MGANRVLVAVAASAGGIVFLGAGFGFGWMAARLDAKESQDSLLVIDMQNDFMDISGSALPVKGGTDIIPKVNKLVERSGWQQVFFTTDSHPDNHISFFENHLEADRFEAFPGSKSMEIGKTGVQYDEDDPYRVCSKGDHYTNMWGASANVNCSSTDSTTRSEVDFEQEVWPKHCVQGTEGQKIHSDVRVPSNAVMVRKGTNTVIDSYGAFRNNVATRLDLANVGVQQGLAENTMDEMLKEKSVKNVFIVGLAFDYCVYYTAEQAADSGYNTYIIKDATASVVPDNDDDKKKALEAKGVKIITLDEFESGKY